MNIIQKFKQRFSSGIHDHGFWYGKNILQYHRYDEELANALAKFFQGENTKSVVDFGCGTGEYLKKLLSFGINCEGYDGNPDTFKISNGLATSLDLSQPVNLKKCFEWVLSLEVGEHIPKKFEKNFIENLHRHNTKGILLSWAIPDQGGLGHFNEQPNEYIKNIFAELGYKNDIKTELLLRQASSLYWFQQTIMVFCKT